MAENAANMAVASGERVVAGDTTKAVMRACAEGNLDEVATLVRREVGSPALTISQLAVDQAAGAGHAKARRAFSCFALTLVPRVLSCEDIRTNGMSTTSRACRPQDPPVAPARPGHTSCWFPTYEHMSHE